MEELISVYNAIRAQSLSAKEQRFKLYYWKVLAIIILLGFSIGEKKPIIENSLKTGLIAFMIPLIVILFDISIKARSNAIKRDGKLLQGIEDEFANKTGIPQEKLPERFFNEKRSDYETGSNRYLETIAQYIISMSAIVTSYLIHYYYIKKLDELALVLICVVILVYCLNMKKEFLRLLKNLVNSILKIFSKKRWS
jgi:hypothetical protein